VTLLAFFIPVINIIEDLLLLVVNTCINPLAIKILVKNIIKNLSLLIASTYVDPLVVEITFI